MANSRYYSSVAQETTLTAAINNSVTSITVASTVGFPGSLPYTLAVDYGSATEELVEVTSVGGLTLTVTRGVDGTSATSHGAGAVVRHVSSARDFTDSRTHEAATTGVHGTTGAIVDTQSAQTLENKTLDMATGDLRNIDIFNGPAWQTAIIGDAANDGINRLHVLDDEVGLNEVWAITDRGAMISRVQSVDGDNSYRIRVLDDDGTTNRFAMLAGGTVNVAPNGTTTFPAVDITSPDTTTTKRAIRVAGSGGGTERFTVWNDGRTDITGTAPALVQLNVKAAASQSASITRVEDSSSNALVEVNSSGVLIGRRTINARTDNSGFNVPLSVHAIQGGTQSVPMTNWVDSTGAAVANIGPNGHATFPYREELTGVTAATGWTVLDQAYREVAGIRFVEIQLTRSGADIVVGATGNFSDIQLCTLPTNWTPNQPLFINGGTGINNGNVRINSTGTADLTDWTPSQTISTGANLRFTYTFIK